MSFFSLFARSYIASSLLPGAINPNTSDVACSHIYSLHFRADEASIRAWLLTETTCKRPCSCSLINCCGSFLYGLRPSIRIMGHVPFASISSTALSILLWKVLIIGRAPLLTLTAQSSVGIITLLLVQREQRKPYVSCLLLII